MKRISKYLQIAIIAMGVIAIVYRTSLKDDIVLLNYMSIVNSIALFLSFMLLLNEIENRMVEFHNKDLKKYNGCMKRNKSIDIFRLFWAFFSFIIVISVALIMYFNKSTLINDVITIGTLTLALSTEIVSKVAAALIYSYK